MGVLTDFIVADRKDAQRVCDSACPSQDFAGLDAKGINPVMIGTLHAVLTGGEFDPAFICGEPLCSGGDDGPWVIEVPQDLVQRLAALDTHQLNIVGVQWAKTEEFSPKQDNWPPKAVQQVLEELARLCNRAIAERKRFLM